MVAKLLLSCLTHGLDKPTTQMYGNHIYNELISGNKNNRNYSYSELISGNKKKNRNHSYNELISGNKKNEWIYNINIKVYYVHSLWMNTFFFFGIEYHFARELKFSRGLSTLDNFVP